MLKPDYTNRFKKDLKLIKKRNWNIELLKKVMQDLVEEKELPLKNRNHSLTGNYIGFQECHIEPDWLLIYQVGNGIIVFNRTGTHSDIFNM